MMSEQNFLAVVKIGGTISNSKEIETRAKKIADELKQISGRILAVIMLDETHNDGLNAVDITGDMLTSVAELCKKPVYFIESNGGYWIYWLPSSRARLIMNNRSSSFGELGTAMMPLGAVTLSDPKLDPRQFAQDAEAAYRAYANFDWSNRSEGETLYTQFWKASGDADWKPTADRLSNVLSNVRSRAFRSPECSTQVHLIAHKKILKR